MSSRLKEKTITGVGWSFADNALNFGVSFVVSIVLSRLLTPAEYGLIGIANIFIVILGGFVDCGFPSALVRKPDCSEEDYSTMFATNLFMSVAVYVILFFCAPFVADFFDREEVTALMRVMSLSLLIGPFGSVQGLLLTKRLDFKTPTKISLIRAVVSGGVGIAMAFAGYGVWALVGSSLVGAVLGTFLLRIFVRWSPKFKFSRVSFDYMWGFGWKLMMSGFIDRTWSQLYQTVVGKCYSPATLGQYAKAQSQAQIFSSNLTGVVQRVSYPALSELQGDKDRMVEAYRKVIKVTMFVTAVCMFAVGAVADPLIYCVNGPQWHEAATYLPIICMYMSLYPLHAINLNMIQVQGRSDIFLILEVMKKIIGIGPLLIGIFVDIYWMMVASVFSGIICFFLNSYYTGKSLHYTSWMQIKDIAPSYGIALIVAASVYFLKFLPVSYWVVLPLQIVVGAVVFFAVCRISGKEEYVEVRGMLRHYMGKLHKSI